MTKLTEDFDTASTINKSFLTDPNTPILKQCGVTCLDCKYYNRSCDNSRGVVCTDFEFDNINIFKTKAMPYLLSNNAVMLDRSKMRKPVAKDEEILPLYSYYVDLINDSLKIIRSKKKNPKLRTAYLFNLSQVRDLLKFEPEANITLDRSGIYYVSL